MQVDTFWPAFYFFVSITLFFGLPLAVLIILYSVIALHLMANPGLTQSSSALRYRRQVVLMLGTVVFSFFVCLLPFRALTLCILIATPEYIKSFGTQNFYEFIIFCRIMVYLNSAINPILYNLMSSKFRDGFRKLLGLKSRRDHLNRKDTVTITSLTSSSRKASSDHLIKRSVISMTSIEDRKKLDGGSISTTIKILNKGRTIVRADESYV
ncbi:hypothetical protein AAG570_009381 [Ranatra chinensis]|uniref:G-protein coupled receptors family 1 profile domain-containing protein n=1 Tax=Ranatra chinensis TaxID=642074 RepID=A0ABD0YNX6_9HEMI